MATSSNNPSGDPPRHPVFRSGDSTSRRVLEDVLRQTASLYSFEPPVDPADLQPLQEVAARLGGTPFALDPVVNELVKAMLRRQLKAFWTSEEQLVSVAERVAQTLFENPDAHDRLENLWLRLTAEA
jgi:hypothetical protein